MNCGAIKELLSRGEPLTQRAQQHIASCRPCRTMLQALTVPQPAPEATHINRMQDLIIASLKPVRPLPSDRALTSLLLTIFVIFSLVGAIPVGYNGFHVLGAYQRLAYYGLILLCAAWFSIATVQQIIPGSKHRTNAIATILVPTLLLALLVSVLFHNFNFNRFVSLGMPCFRLGVVCAAISAALLYLLLRKGFFGSPIFAGATVGLFAGLVGIAVLALHCPIENSAHILVWHLGAMVLAGTGGAVVAELRRLKPPKRDTV
jgi:hypothetical protein